MASYQQVWDQIEGGHGIPWGALHKAHMYYIDNLQNPDTCMHEWLLDTYGVDWAAKYIKIVDEKKFMMFLLEWS